MNDTFPLSIERTNVSLSSKPGIFSVKKGAKAKMVIDADDSVLSMIFI